MTTAPAKGPARGGRRLALYTSVLSQVFALARNVLVARLLGPEEFGIAAIVILTINFLDTFSNAGPQNLLVQARDEDAEPLLAASHAVTLARGVMTSALLLALGGALSEFIGLRVGWPAIAGLAFAAFVGGFLHRGVRMVQRDGDFRPESLNLVAADFASLVASVVVAYLTKSHIAIVAGLAARSVVIVATSHLLARHRYRLNWDRSQLQRFWVFGWPLLINGPLLFLSAQADRLLITHELGAISLGVYSAVLVLIASPSGAILKWLGTIFVPPLAKAYHNRGELRPTGVVYEFTGLSMLAGFLMLVGFATFGALAVSLLYGARYEVSRELVALIAFLQVFRFLRAWPSTLSLSVAASGGILASTAVRLLTLPIGYAGLKLVGGLPGLVAGFVVGEVIALVVSLIIVNRNASREWFSGLAPLSVLAVLAAAAVWSTGLTGEGLAVQALLVVLAAGVGGSVLLLSIAPQEALARLRNAKLWSVARRSLSR